MTKPIGFNSRANSTTGPRIKSSSRQPNLSTLSSTVLDNKLPSKTPTPNRTRIIDRTLGKYPGPIRAPVPNSYCIPKAAKNTPNAMNITPDQKSFGLFILIIPHATDYQLANSETSCAILATRAGHNPCPRRCIWHFFRPPRTDLFSCIQRSATSVQDHVESPCIPLFTSFHSTLMAPAAITLAHLSTSELTSRTASVGVFNMGVMPSIAYLLFTSGNCRTFWTSELSL
jgi:hypothetical protein